jgi:hypothetical protein
VKTDHSPDAGKKVTAELLEWHDATTDKPDADSTCLLWIAYPDGTFDWEAGWLDADGWLLCESGGACPYTVLFWAQPKGPTC